MTISLKSGANILVQRELSVTEPRVEIDLPAVEIEASGPTQRLDLIIGISEGKTPMEAGICPDPRRVGFGLERVVLRISRRPQSRFEAASQVFRRMLSGLREPAG